jgi:hypothetical protein
VQDAGHAIQSFRENEDIKVFLIAQKAGAQGMMVSSMNECHTQLWNTSHL